MMAVLTHYLDIPDDQQADLESRVYILEGRPIFFYDFFLKELDVVLRRGEHEGGIVSSINEALGSAIETSKKYIAVLLRALFRASSPPSEGNGQVPLTGWMVFCRIADAALLSNGVLRILSGSEKILVDKGLVVMRENAKYVDFKDEPLVLYTLQKMAKERPERSFTYYADLFKSLAIKGGEKGFIAEQITSRLLLMCKNVGNGACSAADQLGAMFEVVTDLSETILDDFSIQLDVFGHSEDYDIDSDVIFMDTPHDPTRGLFPSGQVGPDMLFYLSPISSESSAKAMIPCFIQVKSTVELKLQYALDSINPGLFYTSTTCKSFIWNPDKPRQIQKRDYCTRLYDLCQERMVDQPQSVRIVVSMCSFSSNHVKIIKNYNKSREGLNNPIVLIDLRQSMSRNNSVGVEVSDLFSQLTPHMDVKKSSKVGEALKCRLVSKQEVNTWRSGSSSGL